jgi:hypothetical protein
MPRKASKAMIKRVEASIKQYGSSCWTPLLKRQKYKISIEKPKRKKKAKEKPSGS